MSEVTIQLTKPITAHGEEVSELTLREMTPGDVIECGYPIAFDGSVVTPQMGPVAKLIARLSGIPPSSVRQMGMPDYNAAMGAVLGFLGELEGQQNS